MHALRFRECEPGYTSYLLIDIDIPFDWFRAKFIKDWERLARWVIDTYDIKVSTIILNRSVSNNVHITVGLNECIPQDTAIIIEFLLGDDRKRIALKYWRLKEIGDMIDFFRPSDSTPEFIDLEKEK